MKTRILLTIIHPNGRTTIDRSVDLHILPPIGSTLRAAGESFEVRDIELVFKDAEPPYYLVNAATVIERPMAGAVPRLEADLRRAGWGS